MEAPRTRHWARRPRWLTRSSPIQISPASGGSSSPIRLRSVDLPEPEAPATATSSPPLTSRSIPWSTGTGMPPGPVKVLRSPLAFSSMQISGAPPDGFGGRKPRDAEGGVGGGEPAQHHREDNGKCQETRREEEELLSLAYGPGVDGG